jgi:hypothetical protein
MVSFVYVAKFMEKSSLNVVLLRPFVGTVKM